MQINGFFDEAKRLESIDKHGNPLQKLNECVERDVLEKCRRNMGALNKYLEEKESITRTGCVVDASFMDNTDAP